MENVEEEDELTGTDRRINWKGKMTNR